MGLPLTNTGSALKQQALAAQRRQEYNQFLREVGCLCRGCGVFFYFHVSKELASDLSLFRRNGIYLFFYAFFFFFFFFQFSFYDPLVLAMASGSWLCKTLLSVRAGLMVSSIISWSCFSGSVSTRLLCQMLKILCVKHRQARTLVLVLWSQSCYPASSLKTNVKSWEHFKTKGLIVSFYFDLFWLLDLPLGEWPCADGKMLKFSH